MEVKKTNLYQIAISRLIEVVTENFDTIEFESIENDAFNEDYYIYHHEATEDLEVDGVFDWIQYVSDKDQEMYGELTFNEWSNPCRVANMALFYVGDELANEVLNDLNIDRGDEITKDDGNKIIAYLNGKLKPKEE